MPITITRLNAGEVLRYMGCPPEKADASLLAQVESCARELLEAHPCLAAPENRPVWERVRRLFADTPDIFN